MANQMTIRTLLMAASVATAASVTAHAADPDLARTPVISVVGSEASSRPVTLGVGKAVVIDLPRDTKDVLVADPTITNAVIRNPRRAYIIGIKTGQSSVFFFDAQGRQIAGFDIAVKRDLNGIREAIRQVLPHADIRVEGMGADGVILSGHVNTPADAQTAFEIADRLVGPGTAVNVAQGSRVVNAIVIRGRDQVNLRVTVAEVQRDVIKQLGINLNGSFGGGSSVVNFNTQNPFSAYGQQLGANTITGNFRNLTATLNAMDRAGVIRTLAEPNLTAISGETATFVAGGEFPIPNGLSCDTTRNPPICQQQIDFKKFGVSLSFTPVVLSEGRISLRVATEVSDLSTENAITLTQPGSPPLTIPSIRARRAETVVEIPSGGALALAGMIREQTKQAINGLPGLMQLPILGALFKSRDYLNSQTEMMILVTPYIVRAVAQKDLSRPDDGYADTSDPSSFFLGRLNKIYGIAGKVDPNLMYRGKYGFILD
ncbi:type II and III secretion system protein family protein [Pseudorhodoplanes sp.]|uniref:type II and III secretion system protein family protein n=1 Tax=Pseudorhodoplanes sp. TaxID=1934341 RepID=UPI003D14D384